MTELEKVKKIVKYIDAKKAIDIKAIDLKGATIIADYFVICSAGSHVQMHALCDAACEGMTKENVPPRHIEGIKNADWTVVDFDGVMLHIFSRQMREFYGLENLWAEADIIELDDASGKDMI